MSDGGFRVASVCWLCDCTKTSSLPWQRQVDGADPFVWNMDTQWLIFVMEERVRLCRRLCNSTVKNSYPTKTQLVQAIRRREIDTLTNLGEEKLDLTLVTGLRLARFVKRKTPRSFPDFRVWICFESFSDVMIQKSWRTQRTRPDQEAFIVTEITALQVIWKKIYIQDTEEATQWAENNNKTEREDILVTDTNEWRKLNEHVRN